MYQVLYFLSTVSIYIEYSWNSHGENVTKHVVRVAIWNSKQYLKKSFISTAIQNVVKDMLE